MNFASDNAAGVAPAVLEAITRANAGFALGYGNDDFTRAVERRMAALFEREVAVFLVPTGTAANALALAHLTPPWGGVLCHAEAHIAIDECGAPEFFGGGLKLIGLPGVGAKLVPATLAAAIARHTGHRPHAVQAKTVSISQVTEAGTIYTATEVRALAEIAHAHGLKVHMDGARFANALARLGASPAAVSWQAGVDALSFGATKGGALAAEAIVVFDRDAADALHERRKRGGHLVSKHRFVAAQFAAFLADDNWLAWARHANRMADRLAQGLATRGLAPVWPVEANLAFVVLPRAADARLRAAGATYYAWHSDSLPSGILIPDGGVLARLVTSFATTEAEVDRFVALAID
ncbi:MAG TPA: beta-eliminating lyase-related protein [Xanthobacteraceae bacterium]|nr:beta-eliminating lyase-related protein [Xanthobacteraceae bacterium]